MLLLSSQVSSAYLDGLFASPTPLTSTLCGLLTLIAVGAVYTAFQLLHDRKLKKKAGESGWDKFIVWSRKVDHTIVDNWSYVTGTHYRSPALRRVVLITYFTTIALFAAIAPWPFGLPLLTLGVLSIFVVFRHYSIDEDERQEQVPPGQKRIPIEGDLGVEVMAACAFLFVYAPSAFAQLQANGYGFDVPPRAGPFTFVFYTFIEAVKGGSLIDYYDLFADKLGLDHYAGVRNPSFSAKWAIMAYRLSMDVLLPAAAKRLLDVMRREAEGYDLRHIEEALREKDAAQHEAAVEQLSVFALRGRGNARDLLERILEPGKDDRWAIGPWTRSLGS